MQPPKFKIGDRVRDTEKGWTGVVTKVDEAEEGQLCHSYTVHSFDYPRHDPDPDGSYISRNEPNLEAA